MDKVNKLLCARWNSPRRASDEVAMISSRKVLDRKHKCGDEKKVELIKNGKKW